MAIVKAEVIVLKKFDFRETSLIVNFFSLEYGRLNGLLKGIRKDPRKFASSLEPFSCNEIIFYQSHKSDLHLVSQCDLKDNYNFIRKDIKTTAYALYLIDILRLLMPQEEKNPESYRLITSALKNIDSGLDPEKVSRVFLIKLLKITGFKPRLDGCIICDRDINGPAYFNVRRGGLLCPSCNTNDVYSSNILKGTIASILHIEHSPWPEALRLGLNIQVKEELERILKSFMEFHLQIKANSQEFLETIKQ